MRSQAQGHQPTSGPPDASSTQAESLQSHRPKAQEASFLRSLDSGSILEERPSIEPWARVRLGGGNAVDTALTQVPQVWPWEL